MCDVDVPDSVWRSPMAIPALFLHGSLRNVVMSGITQNSPDTPNLLSASNIIVSARTRRRRYPEAERLGGREKREQLCTDRNHAQQPSLCVSS